MDFKINYIEVVNEGSLPHLICIGNSQKTLKVVDLKSYNQVLELPWSQYFSYRKGLTKFMKIVLFINNQLDVNIYDLYTVKSIG